MAAGFWLSFGAVAGIVWFGSVRHRPVFAARRAQADDGALAVQEASASSGGAARSGLAAPSGPAALRGASFASEALPTPDAGPSDEWDEMARAFAEADRRARAAVEGSAP